jgi:hypothetical protein
VRHISELDLLTAPTSDVDFVCARDGACSAFSARAKPQARRRANRSVAGWDRRLARAKAKPFARTIRGARGVSLTLRRSVRVKRAHSRLLLGLDADHSASLALFTLTQRASPAEPGSAYRIWSRGGYRSCGRANGRAPTASLGACQRRPASTTTTARAHRSIQGTRRLRTHQVAQPLRT